MSIRLYSTAISFGEPAEDCKRGEDSDEGIEIEEMGEMEKKKKKKKEENEMG